MLFSTFWSKLCLHNEKIGFCSVCNFHFAGQQGNCNRCSPSLCSRKIPIEFLLFLKLEEKITSFKRARKRLLYAGFAILHSCQLHCPIDVKNGNGSSNAFPGWKLQFFLFSSRHLCCSADEELGQQNAVINQKAPKNLLYVQKSGKEKKRFGCSQLFSFTYLILKPQTTKCLLLTFFNKSHNLTMRLNFLCVKLGEFRSWHEFWKSSMPDATHDKKRCNQG